MNQKTESVLTGDITHIGGCSYKQQKMSNGHFLSWVPEHPYRVCVIMPCNGGMAASSEFDGWVDTTTYDEVGFFVKENGVVRFAKTTLSNMEDGKIHAQAMVELWNRLTDKHYELMGDGIGWAACKRGRNDTPPGVELKDVHRFYYLDENLNSVH